VLLERAHLKRILKLDGSDQVARTAPVTSSTSQPPHRTFGKLAKLVSPPAPAMLG